MAARHMKDPNSTESKELFFTLMQEQRLAIREKLLQSLNSETVAHVRNKVGDAIAEVAGQYAERGMHSDGNFPPPLNERYAKDSMLTDRPWDAGDEGWPELLGVLFQASQSNDYGLREAAFRIFSSTPGIIEKQHEETVTGVFSKGFQDENISV